MNPPVNNWRIFIHEALETQLVKLAGSVAWMHVAEQTTSKNNRHKQVLKTIKRAMYEAVPAAPGRTEHRLGHTIGRQNTAWFRIKILQQFRLFYRYDSVQKIIVYVWVNDEESPSGYPPGSFEELLAQSREI